MNLKEWPGEDQTRTNCSNWNTEDGCCNKHLSGCHGCNIYPVNGKRNPPAGKNQGQV